MIKTFLIASLLHISLLARDINLDHLINTSKQTNKHLFVWLHKTDCGYCERMREFTLEDDSIKKLIDEKFLFVHINVRESDTVTYSGFVGSGRDFAIDVGYDFYPSSLFFDQQGEIIYERAGYQDEKDFTVVLDYVNSRSYEDIEFDTFKRSYKNK